MASQDDLSKIKMHYSNALESINSNNIKQACDIVHNKMGVKLYDLSLDIMDGLKDEEDSTKEPEDFIASKQLKYLIVKVNKALCKESMSKDKEDLNVINSDDKEWFTEQEV